MKLVKLKDTTAVSPQWWTELLGLVDWVKSNCIMQICHQIHLYTLTVVWWHCGMEAACTACTVCAACTSCVCMYVCVFSHHIQKYCSRFLSTLTHVDQLTCSCSHTLAYFHLSHIYCTLCTQTHMTVYSYEDSHWHNTFPLPNCKPFPQDPVLTFKQTCPRNSVFKLKYAHATTERHTCSAVDDVASTWKFWQRHMYCIACL